MKQDHTYHAAHLSRSMLLWKGGIHGDGETRGHGLLLRLLPALVGGAREGVRKVASGRQPTNPGSPTL